jgi:hypothetical protein
LNVFVLAEFSTLKLGTVAKNFYDDCVTMEIFSRR